MFSLGFFVISFVLILEIQGATIINNNGFSIYNDGDKFICGGLECPKGSARCTVTKKTRQNDSSLVDINKTCYDSSSVVTAQDHQTVENDSPGSYYNVVISSGGGGYSLINNVDPVVAQRIADEVKQINDQVQENIKQINYNLQKELGDLQYRLEHMFGNYR